METRLVLVHNAEPQRRVRRRGPDWWNIVWLREITLDLSYDLQIDMEYEDSQALGCDVRFFSSLGVSGEFEGKEVDVYFKRIVGERAPGDVSIRVAEDIIWVDIYVDEHALNFVVMMYDKAQRLDEPLGIMVGKGRGRLPLACELRSAGIQATGRIVRSESSGRTVQTALGTSKEK
jgi:hypothetical protein